jgi:glycosyltransferase involved in cell wall biosynthesis
MNARLHETVTARPLRVLMLGPGLVVRGGISAVERLVLAALPPNIAATHIPTMVEGSKGTKLLTYLRALALAWLRMGQRPDIVHIHFASRASTVRKMSLARLALARGCRVVMHAHGAGFREYWASLSPSARGAILEVLRRVDSLIVLGERWRAFFISIGVPKERIAVLLNPVALPPAVPQRPGGQRVLFVKLGIIGRRKGSFELIDALAKLRPEILANVRLAIAGNGEHAALRSRIASHGLQSQVEVHGWLSAEQCKRLLASADAFVLPSHNEGLPMAMLEAMAWGLPPIVTPVGSIAEVVQHERNGLLTPPGDVDALARAMERLAADRELRLRLGAAARRRVEGLGIESYIEKLCALYEAIACAR